MLFDKTAPLIKGVFIAIVLSASLLGGCATNKPQIEMSDQQNFASIETFYVKPPLNSVNQTVESQIESTITTVLEGKGLKVTGEQNADVTVAFFPSTAQEENGKSVSVGLGTGIFGRTTGISLGSIFSVPVGEQITEYQNLQIDIIRGDTFIYSAAGRAELDAKDSITLQRELATLIRKLLAPYPDKSGR